MHPRERGMHVLVVFGIEILQASLLNSVPQAQATSLQGHLRTLLPQSIFKVHPLDARCKDGQLYTLVASLLCFWAACTWHNARYGWRWSRRN
jgi:hypothetical protein